MGHYSKVVQDGNRLRVEKVIVATAKFFAPKSEGGDGYVDDSPGQWLKTSYNTRGGVHYDPVTGEPSADQSQALRGNFAGQGDTYDPEVDKFYPVQPYPSWSLNTNTWSWEPPVPYPADGKRYRWDENITDWAELA